MPRILFVCHGNICRSPMAEFVMKELVRQNGLSDQYEIDSCAASTEELGSDIYPPAKRMLREQGIPFTKHYARQISRIDYDRYDYIIAMDRRNLQYLPRLIGSDPAGKVQLLLHFAGRQDDVADPWYTGRFDQAFADILEGCQGLFTYLQK